MSNETKRVIVRGKASFAKILGDPVPNYNKNGKEWKMDLVLTTEEAVNDVKEAGIEDRIKRKDGYLDGRPFLSFKRAEFQKSGKPNDPIPVVDAAGRPWDREKLIGNESDVDVKFNVVDYGKGKFAGVYIQGVRVLDLVPYEAQQFAPLDKDDPYNRQAEELAAFKEDFGLGEAPEVDVDIDDLDDEIPE